MIQGKPNKEKWEEELDKQVTAVMKHDLSKGTIEDVIRGAMLRWQNHVRSNPFMYENERKFVSKKRVETSEFVSHGVQYKRVQIEVYESRNSLSHEIEWYVMDEDGNYKKIYSGDIFSNKEHEVVPYHAVQAYQELVRL